MSYQFVYQDGLNKFIDEKGEPTLDENDKADALPLDSIIEFDFYQKVTQAELEMEVDDEEQDEEQDEDKEENDVDMVDITETNKAKGGNSNNANGRSNRKYNDSDITRVINLYNEKPFVAATVIARAPTGTIDDAREELTKLFGNLEVGKTRLREFVKNDCALSFKQVRHDSSARNSEEKLELRCQFVKDVINLRINYLECIFIDEAGFDISLHRSRGWAKKGETPVAVTPQLKSENRSVLGAVCAEGIILLSLRPPASSDKKRKLDDGSVSRSKGTTTGHFKTFIDQVCKILNTRDDFKGRYLVMDNASIHKNASIQRIIESHGFKCLYLSPFSPELNPIEQVWSMLKGKVRRHTLEKDTLSSRIKEAATQIKPYQIRNCIQHSINCFEQCLNKRPL
ncbi:uncharacterized protein KGF55_005168 [Candida pseudojiufengensis]|uniref:uncharacterized protein n=1 Tax=Candida pseudojiufengensis TaxID=497109 RepID=UPI002224FB3A|nr:uncharacterized protein KGF55_005168 [Candida pseudojiufengensis]KAI5959936.1 hypothetical protein KGF55_005168 [Candida pseudojiufengensis]